MLSQLGHVSLYMDFGRTGGELKLTSAIFAACIDNNNWRAHPVSQRGSCGKITRRTVSRSKALSRHFVKFVKYLGIGLTKYMIPRKLFWLGPGFYAGREHPRYLGVVLEPANEKLLALFVSKFSSVALGLVEIRERFPPQTPVLTILKQPKLMVVSHVCPPFGDA